MLPGSYTTMIGADSGVSLTRSQMMQLALARALASDSSVVVVHHSLAALDHSAHAAVLSPLHALHPRTLIITSTAPSVSQMCHHTVLLVAGAVVELLSRAATRS